MGKLQERLAIAAILTVLTLVVLGALGFFPGH